MTMHVIRFLGNERLSERLSWHLFGHLRRKRIGRLKAVREVRKRGFVTIQVYVGTFCFQHSTLNIDTTAFYPQSLE